MKLYVKMKSSIVCFTQVDESANTWREVETTVQVVDGDVIAVDKMHSHEIQRPEAQTRINQYLVGGGKLLLSAYE